jgi:hypothetical protein
MWDELGVDCGFLLFLEALQSRLAGKVAGISCEETSWLIVTSLRMLKRGGRLPGN